jgi:hypothetical protein
LDGRAFPNWGKLRWLFCQSRACKRSNVGSYDALTTIDKAQKVLAVVDELEQAELAVS